jgi:hypothetical protein
MDARERASGRKAAMLNVGFLIQNSTFKITQAPRVPVLKIERIALW